MKKIIVVLIPFMLSSCGLFGTSKTDPLDKPTIHNMSDSERISLLLQRLKETKKKLQTAREQLLKRGQTIGMYEKLFEEIEKCDKAYQQLQKHQTAYERLRDKVYYELLRLEQIKGKMEMHKELYGEK